MPTGYTDAIKNGITFEQFAMNCARAFGALVTMRDEPSDAEIPTEFEPATDYYDKQIAEAHAFLLRLDQMTPQECEIAAFAEREESNAQCRERIRSNDALRAKYEAMLSKAIDWVPPSEEHKEMQRFMVDQIQQSLTWDCNNKYAVETMAALPLSGAEWKARNQVQAARDLAYSTEKRAEEIERTAKRNQWVRELRASLSR